MILTHWGRVTHICATKLTTIGSDNGLSPGRRQAIIWTSVGILVIGPLGTNFSEIFNRNIHIFIQENAFENVVWEKAAILSRPQCVKKHSLFGCSFCFISGNFRIYKTIFLEQCLSWNKLIFQMPFGEAMLKRLGNRHGSYLLKVK